MSFFDKVLNGVVVVVLEQINPYKNQQGDDHTSIPFYKHIVVYVSGATSILTILGVIAIFRTKFINSGQKSIKSSDKPCDEKTDTNTTIRY